MGMTIEDIEQWARQNNCTIVSGNWWNAAQDTINKYQQLQADYEARLKADMVAILDKIRAKILEEKECAYADFERYKVEYLGQDWEDALDSLPQDDFRYGMERAIELIDKYKEEVRIRNDNTKRDS